MPRLILPIIAMLASSAGAAEQTSPSPIIGYATVGGWQVYVDMEQGHSCHLVGSYASGASLSFGIDRRKGVGEGKGYLVVANPAWKGFQDGRTYPVVVQFDGSNSWRGKAQASVLDGIPALTLRFADPSFARQFAERKGLTLMQAGRRLAELDLASSGKAVRTMFACQTEVNGIVSEMEVEDVAEDGTKGV